MKKRNAIQTERLLLVPTSEEDASFIMELVNTPKWLKYIGDRNIESVEDARNYICEKMLPQEKRLGFGNFTVVRKSDQRRLGTCGIYDREGLTGFDIGFAFLPEFEGKGYAYEAANELLKVAFSKFGLNEISAITTKENIASQKLLEKLGLTFQKMTTIPNDSEDLMLYSIANS